MTGKMALIVSFMLVLVLASCTSAPRSVQTPMPAPAPTPSQTPTPSQSSISPISIHVERAFPNLSFREMTNLVQPDDSSGLIFVTGQNTGTLLGKILRIDVSALSASGNYTIPADNPFVNTAGARPEIWAFGLRNPWRFSFDRETGILWTGDVGHSRLHIQGR